MGALTVEPALLIVSANSECRRLEPRVMQVLVVLAEAGGGVVSKDLLIERCWDGRAVTDDSVQRCIAALRKLTAGFTPAPFAIETIPKVGYRLLAAAGEAPAEASEHVAAPARQDADGPLANLPAKRQWALPRVATGAIAILLAIAVFAIALNRFSQNAPNTTVAVMAFDSVAASDEKGETLARILPPAIAHQLSAAGISVLAPDASFNKSAREVSAPPVAYIIDGAVSSAVDGYQIIVRINGAKRSETLWSRSVFVSPEDLHQASAEVYAAVGSALTGPVKLFGEDSKRADILAAKLRLSDLMREDKSVEALEEAERLLRRAPKDISALVLFSEAVGAGLGEAPLRERAKLVERAKRAAQRAIAAQPENGRAYFALFQLYPAMEYKRRIALLEAGIARDPENSDLQHAMALALATTGHLAEARQWQAKSLAGDPFSRSKTQSVILSYADKGLRSEARDLVDRAQSYWPNDDGFVHLEIALASRFLDADLFRRALAESGPSLSEASQVRLTLLADAIDLRTDEALDAASENCAGGAAASYLTICAYVLSLLGSGEDALMALDLFIEGEFASTEAQREADFLANPLGQPKSYVLFREPFSALYGHPRMWALFDRLGLVDYWLESNSWPDFCHAPGTELQCGRLAEETIKARAP